jgi:hypothetical protein
MHDQLIQTLRAIPWSTDSETLAFTPEAPTMLAPYEAQMLRWLTARGYQGRGDVVDLGCFLGGSSCSFGNGLSANPAAASFKRPALHVFDMFVCPNEPYSMGLIGSTKQPGESVLDLFEKFTKPYAEWIRTYPGDLLEQRYTGRDVELLFVDIAKTHDLNDFVIREFFARTVGAGTMVVHQDYNHPWLPWVHITANILRPVSAYIADVAGSRLVVLTDKPSNDMLAACMHGATTPEEKLAILDRERDINENAYSAAMVQLSSAWLAFLEFGSDAYEARLNHPLLEQQYLPEQVEQMRTSARNMGSVSGYDRYHDNYFKPR